MYTVDMYLHVLYQSSLGSLHTILFIFLGRAMRLLLIKEIIPLAHLRVMRHRKKVLCSCQTGTRGNIISLDIPPSKTGLFPTGIQIQINQHDEFLFKLIVLSLDHGKELVFTRANMRPSFAPHKPILLVRGWLICEWT